MDYCLVNDSVIFKFETNDCYYFNHCLQKMDFDIIIMMLFTHLVFKKTKNNKIGNRYDFQVSSKNNRRNNKNNLFQAYTEKNYRKRFV